MKLIQLDEFIGNKHAVDFVKKSIQNDHFPHAIIFSGPKGVGKSTLALTLTGLSFCENAVDFKFCGECKNCRLLAAGTHPDFHVLSVEKGHKEILIESVRSLISDMQKKPFIARAKSVVIDGAELMTNEASSAMLKLLEEPPGISFLFLITALEDNLLPTIKSRCQSLKFHAIPLDELEEFLKRESPVPSLAGVAASFAEGSIGKALEFGEQELEKINFLIDIFSRIIVQGDYSASMELEASMTADRSRFDEILKYCYIIMRDILCISLGDERAIPIIDTRIDALKSISDSTYRSSLMKLLKEFEVLTFVNKRNLNIKLNAQYFTVNLLALRNKTAS